MRTVSKAPPVIYSDHDFFVCVKPGHQIVHPHPVWRDGPSTVEILQRRLERKIYPVHRLDRAVSGLMAIGWSSLGAKRLQQALQSPTSIKEYVTLVRGYPPPQGEIEIALTDRKTGTLKPAKTSYWTLAKLDRCTLLKVRIHTGRHHQIRRHFDKLAHQIIGCTHFGKGKINRFFREHYALTRLFLHATRLELDLPNGRERVICRAPLPEDLRKTLSQVPGCEKNLLSSL